MYLRDLLQYISFGVHNLIFRCTLIDDKFHLFGFRCNVRTDFNLLQLLNSPFNF